MEIIMLKKNLLPILLLLSGSIVTSTYAMEGGHVVTLKDIRRQTDIIGNQLTELTGITTPEALIAFCTKHTIKEPAGRSFFVKKALLIEHISYQEIPFDVIDEKLKSFKKSPAEQRAQDKAEKEELLPEIDKLRKQLKQG